MGSDPLGHLNTADLWQIAQGGRLCVKSFIMDQRYLAGIGNIYACEILYQTKISPWRSANDLTIDQWELIGETTRSILEKAIACRGTTISDWRDLFGREGEYQNYLQVYGREGGKCPRCGGEIQRRKINGRGTYFCPTCQK